MVLKLPQALDERIRAAKARLAALRPLSGDVLLALRHADDVELTFTSNAIEGNTLTHSETALVIEKGITIGGKLLAEHLEAQDHYEAILHMRALAHRTEALSERDIIELHRRIVLRSRPEIAGRLSALPRRVAGSAAVFPNPAKLPELMNQLGQWLAQAPDDAPTAFEAHLRLVSIHPFADGNGRTARLLMNLVLLRSGLVPVAIRPADRKAYLDAVEACQTGGPEEPYVALLAGRLADTLDEHVARCEAALPPDTD